ncbi:hypothetical protein LPJ59_005203 [Coemansia sp. RSA 2399]|nr:hypothetical protein LPJ59_005203 [Coemansia sp. RSA 2399]KAJ1895119.1 hypothetical protein LPJ81_005032 [Coemansia sp. IMI 209127]
MDFECLDAGQGVHVKHFFDDRVCIVTTYIGDILIAAQPDDELAEIGKPQTIVGSLNSKPTVTYLCAAEHSISNLKQSAKFSTKLLRQPTLQLSGADAAYSDYFFLLSRTH